MHLHADVIEITYGQSEVLKTKDDALVLVAKLVSGVGVVGIVGVDNNE